MLTLKITFATVLTIFVAAVSSALVGESMDYSGSVGVLVSKEIVGHHKKKFRQEGRITVTRLRDGSIVGLTVGHLLVPGDKRGKVTYANIYFKDFSVKVTPEVWKIVYDRHSDVGVVYFDEVTRSKLQKYALPFSGHIPKGATLKLLAKKEQRGRTYITSPCRLNTDGKKHALATPNSTVPITSAAITARCNRKYIGAGYSGSGLIAETPDGQSFLVGVFFGDTNDPKAPYNAAFTTIPKDSAVDFDYKLLTTAPP